MDKYEYGSGFYVYHDSFVACSIDNMKAGLRSVVDRMEYSSQDFQVKYLSSQPLKRNAMAILKINLYGQSHALL